MTRILIFAFLLFGAVSPVFAQGLHLKNLILTNQPNSKIIYMGIDNLFKVTSLQRIVSIEASEASAALNLDTIKLVPRKMGKIQVIVQTSEGVYKLTFDSYRLPPVSAVIASDSNSIL